MNIDIINNFDTLYEKFALKRDLIYNNEVVQNNKMTKSKSNQ